MKIGQLAIKLCGRDGGNYCIILDKIDNTYVLIDGNVRRKKCNISHLEILDKVLKIKENAPTSEVYKAMEEAGIKIINKSSKRTPQKRMLKKRKQKEEKPKEETNKEIKKSKKK